MKSLHVGGGQFKLIVKTAIKKVKRKRKIEKPEVKDRGKTGAVIDGEPFVIYTRLLGR